MSGGWTANVGTLGGGQWLKAPGVVYRLTTPRTPQRYSAGDPLRARAALILS